MAGDAACVKGGASWLGGHNWTQPTAKTPSPERPGTDAAMVVDQSRGP